MKKRRRRRVSRERGRRKMRMRRGSDLLLEINLMYESQQTEELLASESPSDTSAVSMATL